MGIVLDLESFDTSTEHDADTPPASFEDGFAAGYADAERQFEANQSRLKETLILALNDSVFGYQEAQEHFVSGMQSYLEAVIDKILPAALVPALHANLLSVLTLAHQQNAQAPINLKVSTDQFLPVSELVNELELSHVSVEVDDALTTHAAFMSPSDRELTIDLDAALKAIKDHSAILFEPNEKVS